MTGKLTQTGAQASQELSRSLCQERIKCKYKFRDKYCTCFSKFCEDLPICDDNCQIYEDFKQLACMTQECEEYKKLAADFKDVNKQLGYKYLTIKKECEELKEYIQEREVWGDHCEFCKHNDKENCHQNIILDNLKTINSYRKALEEIETIAGAKDNCCFACKAMKQILKVISKVKGD